MGRLEDFWAARIVPGARREYCSPRLDVGCLTQQPIAMCFSQIKRRDDTLASFPRIDNPGGHWLLDSSKHISNIEESCTSLQVQEPRKE